MNPSIGALKEKWPHGKLYLFTLKRNSQISRLYNCFEKILYLDISSFINFFKSLYKNLIFIRKQKFFLVIDFEQFARISSLITLVSGIPHRVGFKTPFQLRSLSFTIKVEYKEDAHMAKIFYKLVQRIGIKSAFRKHLQLVNVSKNAQKKVDTLVKNIGNFVVIHPGSGENFKYRRWPVYKYIALSKKIFANLGMQIIWIGKGCEEQKIIDIIQKHTHRRGINLCNKLTLEELFYLFTKAKLFIGNDSGPLHLASLAGTKIVGIFGPNTPFLYGACFSKATHIYHQLKCSPCITNINMKLNTCKNPLCIREIDVEEVWRAVVKILHQ